jgi:hypothetical protein
MVNMRVGSVVTNKEYHQLHKKKRNAYGREYNRTHSITLAEYQRRWKLENPDKYLANSRRQNRTKKGRYEALKSNAKVRGLKVSISFDEFSKLNSKPCYYCGGSVPETGGGLDRINSALGYIRGNVRPCCKVCNLAKRTMTTKDFKNWIRKVYHAWAEKGEK